MIRKLARDLLETTRAATGCIDAPNVTRVLLTSDSFRILGLTRVREMARRFHVPVVNRALRLWQMAIYGVEIGKNVELGEGVYFVHTLGIIIGGDAKIGNRVRFMGSNTVGTAKDDGYPTVGDDVIIGCGARILGNVEVGRGAIIGANAVVIEDVPAGATVVGVPARVVSAQPVKAAPPARRKLGSS
jgi:serine O-acetyltransferase